MIIFRNLKFRNFLSTGNNFTEIDLTKSKRTLVVGSNGAGKCLDPTTEIDIEFHDSDVQQAYEDFIKKCKKN
jgi:hypothetical protein